MAGGNLPGASGPLLGLWNILLNNPCPGATYAKGSKVHFFAPWCLTVKIPIVDVFWTIVDSTFGVSRLRADSGDSA